MTLEVNVFAFHNVAIMGSFAAHHTLLKIHIPSIVVEGPPTLFFFSFILRRVPFQAIKNLPEDGGCFRLYSLLGYKCNGICIRLIRWL